MESKKSELSSEEDEKDQLQELSELPNSNMSNYMKFIIPHKNHQDSPSRSNLCRQDKAKKNTNLNRFKEKVNSQVQQNADKLHANFSSQVFKKHFGLRKVIGNQKKNILAEEFKKKIKRNIASAPPVSVEIYAQKQEQNENFLSQIEGVRFPILIETLYLVFSLISTIAAWYIASLGLIQDEIYHERSVQVIQLLICCTFALQIVFFSITSKTINGKKLNKLKQILNHYIRSKFIIDVLCLFVYFTCQFDPEDIGVTKFIRLVCLLKANQFYNKLSKLQSMMSYSFKREKYFALIKIFIVNFTFAHVLSILMMEMTHFQASQNWLQKAGLDHTSTYQQYAWAFYWAVTTMLTVGFGDITPANYKQALCLSIIQTISCILLAYTINCVGGIISSIRSQDLEKQKNLTTMRRIAQEKGLSEDLQMKVCHYIKETDKLKKKFQLQGDKKFISTLTNDLKSQIFKQSNQKTFKNLYFFKNLTEKTLMMLAEQIDTVIAHPQEIVFKSYNPEPRILILVDGKVGYSTHSPKSKYNQTVFNQIKVKKGGNPFLLDILFISKTEQTPYNIRSLQHSVISWLSCQKFQEILKNCKLDYEIFCQLRDSSKHRVDQFQTITCELCKDVRHKKINCPKLHYIPFRQIVVLKYLQQFKKLKSFRNQNFDRHPLYQKKFSSVKFRKECKNFQKMIFGKYLHTDCFKTRQIIKTQQDLTLQPEKLKMMSFQYERQESFSAFSNIVEKKLFDFFQKKEVNFNFYTIDSVDLLEDFKYYFVDCNPSLLKSVPLKKKVKKAKMDNQDDQRMKNSEQNILDASMNLFLGTKQKNNFIDAIKQEEGLSKKRIKSMKKFHRQDHTEMKVRKGKTIAIKKSKFQHQQ